jgi:hypothetical protein
LVSFVARTVEAAASEDEMEHLRDALEDPLVGRGADCSGWRCDGPSGVERSRGYSVAHGARRVLALEATSQPNTVEHVTTPASTHREPVICGELVMPTVHRDRRRCGFVGTKPSADASCVPEASDIPGETSLRVGLRPDGSCCYRFRNGVGIRNGVAYQRA